MSLKYTSKELEDNLKAMFVRGSVLPIDVDVVNTVCNIVYIKHFSGYKSAKEDLMQEGRMGILDLTSRENQFDPTNSALNYAYTRVRNCMTNFLQRKKPDVFSDPDDAFESIEDMATGEFNEEVISYIKEKLKQWKVDPLVGKYVMIYFFNRLGIPLNVSVVGKEVSREFVIEYSYYVNLVELLLVKDFVQTKVLRNPIKEIIDILLSDVAFFEAFKHFVKTEKEDTVFKMLYLFSGNTLKFPTKSKILKTDLYLTIYKDSQKGTSIDDLVRKYSKPEKVIRSIIDKFSGAPSSGPDGSVVRLRGSIADVEGDGSDEGAGEL